MLVEAYFIQRKKDEEKRLKLSSFGLLLFRRPLHLMGQLTNDKSMGGPSLTIQYYVEEERRVPLTQVCFFYIIEATHCIIVRTSEEGV